MAEHFLIYLDLARVQDTVVSYLPDNSLNHHNPSLLYGTGEYMLLQMQYIEQRMNNVSQKHPVFFMLNFLTDYRWLYYHLNGRDSTASPKCPP